MRHSLKLVAPALVLLMASQAGAQTANATPAPSSPTADNLPIYEVDPTWPPTLPNDWILGDIRGLIVVSCCAATTTLCDRMGR